MANEYNQSKFQEEIDAAGIPNVGVNSNGAVFPPEGVTYTPAQLATIETVRTNHNPAALSEEQLIAQARQALTQVRIYLRNQLMSSAPHTPQQIVNNIKPAVDGNAKLTQMMTNQLTITNPIMGWAVTLNPSTLDERRKYIQVVEWIAGATPNE